MFKKKSHILRRNIIWAGAGAGNRSWSWSRNKEKSGDG